jgi:hypothetical protein
VHQRWRLFFWSTLLGTKGFFGGKGSDFALGSSLARASRTGRSAGEKAQRALCSKFPRAYADEVLNVLAVKVNRVQKALHSIMTAMGPVRFFDN